jgi:hypothetical protein
MKLTAKHQTAAVLVAEDRLTDEQIASEVRVHRATLAKWKQQPEFIASVSGHTSRLTEQALECGIARREVRLSVLQEAHSKLLRLIDERAAAPEMQHVPGGKTGLLVRTEKIVGVGAGARTIEEFSFDASVVRELRSLHERAAKELGQEVERREVGGSLGITPELIDSILGDD